MNPTCVILYAVRDGRQVLKKHFSIPNFEVSIINALKMFPGIGYDPEKVELQKNESFLVRFGNSIIFKVLGGGLNRLL